jgi:hypothetical protein
MSDALNPLSADLSTMENPIEAFLGLAAYFHARHGVRIASVSFNWDHYTAIGGPTEDSLVSCSVQVAMDTHQLSKQRT